MDGLTVGEMAALLGEKHKTIKARLDRAGIVPKAILSGICVYSPDDFEKIKNPRRPGRPAGSRNKKKP